MGRVILIHWNPREAAGHAARLQAAGHTVEHGRFGPATIRSLCVSPPDAVIIDLTRAPSQGRDVAIALRISARTRRVPMVLAGGDPGKVAAIRKVLPDAAYAVWPKVVGALRLAIARPPPDPVVPSSAFAGYSGTPLPKKLGLKAGMVVALIGAPAGFEGAVGHLPEGATLRRGARGRADLTIWFPRSRADLRRRVAFIGRRAGTGGLWIAWPKQASGIATDLTQVVVREAGLAAGLVDYKICAMDETWSGLKFARRGGRPAPRDQR